ncbi:MAG: HAMP domain-containing sensor histidine kinase [bacterium]|nr:HAMP domain-containing sensor histidine kinase [bacterium]
MKKVKFSIFFKLILLIIVFIVLANLAIGFFIRFSLERPPNGPFNRPPPPPHLHEYAIKEIGFPPDTVKAIAFSKELNSGIRYETSSFKWTTGNEIPGIEDLKDNREFRGNDERFAVKEKGRMYFINKVSDGYVIFSQMMPRDYINFDKAIPAIILIVTILGSMLYFSLRWIFGPVKILSEEVEQISAGNFSNTIHINRNDELGRLGDSINEMKTNISGMMKAKESLLIDVSHELRSPLTRIKLANEFVDNEKIKDKIKDDVREMEAMITELLETYRMESGHGKLLMEECDIVELVKNLVEKFSHARINFRTEFTNREIRINKGKIEIALGNILDNAVKYSNDRPVDVNIRQGADGNETVVTIKDRGNGINQEELNKIFEPFYRIDKSRDKKITGYGLGLSLVKRILDSHNAKIELKSIPTFGTEFNITFQNI